MMALETQEALLCVIRGVERPVRRTISSPGAEEGTGLVQECSEKGNDVLRYLQAEVRRTQSTYREQKETAVGSLQGSRHQVSQHSPPSERC